jgi:hypothetical protein
MIQANLLHSGMKCNVCGAILRYTLHLLQTGLIASRHGHPVHSRHQKIEESTGKLSGFRIREGEFYVREYCVI